MAEQAVTDFLGEIKRRQEAAMSPEDRIGMHRMEAAGKVTKCLADATEAFAAMGPSQDEMEEFKARAGSLQKAMFRVRGGEAPAAVEMVPEKRIPRLALILPRYSDLVSHMSRESAFLHTMPLSHEQDRKFRLVFKSSECSLLARGLNEPWAWCMSQVDPIDYVAIYHADIYAPGPWLFELFDEFVASGYDCLHVVNNLKDKRALTSTAYGSLNNEWGFCRRLTTHEIRTKLPETFDITHVVKAIGLDGFPVEDRPVCLLPNTGCIVWKVTPALRDLVFTIKDRIDWVNGLPEVRTVSEDWHFGRELAKRGLRVGGTSKVKLDHLGIASYQNWHDWGTWKTDESFIDRMGLRPKQAVSMEAQPA